MPTNCGFMCFGRILTRKLDKRGLRILNDPLDEKTFEEERPRIESEVIERMKKFISLYQKIVEQK